MGVNVIVGGTAAVDVDAGGRGVRVRADVGAGAASVGGIAAGAAQLVTNKSAKSARMVGFIMFSNKMIVCV